MARLEELKAGVIVEGILPNQRITVLAAKWLGTTGVELTYRAADGQLGSELLYRSSEPDIEIVNESLPWSFDGDAENFRLASEAYRIKLAHLFDPRLAVHTSQVEPLPHQITAVYEEMLPRQPLRYLLADDPGAGKTIMTGLYLKELLMRGDLKRCLIVCPGSLVDQWQAELSEKFQLHFEIGTLETFNAARTGNLFQEKDLLICRLDQLSRNESIQEKLKAAHWDVIVCDEAHKMSASAIGNKVNTTGRYKLGKLLGDLTRHFLLLTATPHNGKEADFQLFMALLDADRFEGRFREGAPPVDTSDLMRRMVKEDLLKFDGTRLFPERFAYTVNYKLSEAETHLYDAVTEYVREEMNRAAALLDGKQGSSIGFALTILQRRLASSPEAIYCSIQARRERLEARLAEEKRNKTGPQARLDSDAEMADEMPTAPEEIDEFYDDATAEEVEDAEERILARASAAQTIAELHAEIQTLRDLERLAKAVRHSGTDRKWEELSKFLQKQSDATAADELFDETGHRRKLIIFTEHRATLSYLAERIRTVIGRHEAVVTIHGGLRSDQRREIQEKFTHDREVQILLATDAAGEGINLQRAHLMVNYDLPWNPNRVEQRFGRVHRIGQLEQCYLWNLVATETREGEVFEALLFKLEQQRRALGGAVFDVLGQCFTDRSLRNLLIDAIREGNKPEAKARLTEVIDTALDADSLRKLIEERSLVHGTLNTAQLGHIRDEMARAEARRLQPHFIAAFFREAFKHLGGRIVEREPKRYEIRNVPAVIRKREVGTPNSEAIQQRYERITFEKEQTRVQGKPLAALVCPGHPLLDASLALILDRHRPLLKQGTVLVDPHGHRDAVRVLFYLEHVIQDGRVAPDGSRRKVSQQMQFVEINSDGDVSTPGYAPYLDYRAITADERPRIADLLAAPWLQDGLEARILEYAVEHLIPKHLAEVQTHKEALVKKTMDAVKARLTKEIEYLDNRAYKFREQAEAGKSQASLNAARDLQRAAELRERLDKRLEDLKLERRISPMPPTVIGGALIIPECLLETADAETATSFTISQADRARVDRVAVAAVMAAERTLGRTPKEMPHEHPGYDIESRDPETHELLFIEVKGKSVGATTVTVSKTQIFTAFNKPDNFILAVVEVEGETAKEPRYIREPFQREPDFGVTSVNYNLNELLARSEPPR